MNYKTQRLKFFYAFAFSVNFFVGMLSLAVPLLAIKLHANNLHLGLIGTVASLAYIITVPLAGILADRIPKNLQAGIFASIFGLLVCLLPRANNLLEIYLITTGYFISLAMVWPALESAMTHYASSKELSRIAGWYNVSWCTGAMLGIYLAGYLYAQKPHLVFWLPGILAIILGTAFASSFQPPARTSAPAEELKTGPVYFLYFAWLANGMAYFSLNQIRNIFPKLGLEMGISSANLGLLLMLLNFAQAFMFVLLNLSIRWHFRFWVLILAMLLNASGQLLVSLSDKMLGFGLAFFLIGVSAGISYSASLFYAISLSARLAGTRSGWHEFYLGFGALLGPLFGGLLAQYLSPRIPYLASAVLILLVLLAQIIYFARRASSS